VNREYNVLFLCTGNSARSVMAECAINRWGKGKFRGFSAGSHPKGAINPFTLELLAALNYETKELRSKSWDEFSAAGSPGLDFVFTVCDQAAAEQCPVWPGQPITAHWGVADPAAFEGTADEKRRFFARVYRELENRIKLFTSLRIDALDSFALQQRVREIGNTRLPAESAD
jgi:arsenate reductase